MKAKLMALILAAGLSITGIAMTTQAAGANTTDTCKHKTLYLKEHFEGATYYNGIYNWVTYSKWYYCSNSNCSYSILVDSYGTLELHNYEQIYYRDGRVQSICTDCGDSYDCSYPTLVDSYETPELHNYKQIYYRDGRVQSICTDCGDSYFGEL